MRNFLTLKWLLPIGGFFFGLGMIITLGLYLRPHNFGGTLLQSPQTAYDFTLTGPDERLIQLSDYRGKVILLFFGYTACPDVCPTSLQALAGSLDKLGRRAEQVQVLMVSVDPEKDKPARMQAYLEMFDPRIIGLTGDAEAIAEAATHYGVFYEKRPYGDQPGAYLVDHTATIMLVDPQGYLRVVYPYGTAADAIAADVRYVLTH